MTMDTNLLNFVIARFCLICHCETTKWSWQSTSIKSHNVNLQIHKLVIFICRLLRFSYENLAMTLERFCCLIIGDCHEVAFITSRNDNGKKLRHFRRSKNSISDTTLVRLGLFGLVCFGFPSKPRPQSFYLGKDHLRP